MKKLLTVLTTVLMIVCMSVPAMAYTVEDMPAADDFWDKETYPYAVLQSVNENYWNLWLFSKRPYVEDGKVKIDKCPHYNYTLEGGKWVTPGMSDQSQELVLSYVIDSNVDILDKDSNVVVEGGGSFFTPPPPLAELVLEVTEEELVEVTIPEMVGAMRVLVPCGVGLMALLVGLKLFGKRSLIFRS